MNIRLCAARVIDEVTHGNSLNAVLEKYTTSIKVERDRAFLQAICYGVCRYYDYLDAVLSHLLKKPMKAKESDVHAVLLVGLYQLTHMRVPEHAAVDETTKAMALLKKPWARGLCNAILREYLRKKAHIATLLQDDEEASYTHPAWLIERIKQAWPHDWQTILNANNTHPPFALRVNTKQISRESYLLKLQALQMNAQVITGTDEGIVLDEAVPVNQLPGFQTGMVSIQDGGAQLAASFLELAAGQIVLDACAAPGGKLMHILEREPNLKSCVAVEKNPERLALIQANLARAQLSAKCIAADVSEVSTWWDQQLFDRILVDAPCSASGVIRRHPDIKLLRHPEDIARYVNEQFNILTALWPTLKPGGLMVYATCSIFPEENEAVMQAFFSKHTDAEESMLKTDVGIKKIIGRQILPGAMDGFYYARITKR